MTRVPTLALDAGGAAAYAANSLASWDTVQAMPTRTGALAAGRLLLHYALHGVGLHVRRS